MKQETLITTFKLPSGANLAEFDRLVNIGIRRKESEGYKLCSTVMSAAEAGHFIYTLTFVLKAKQRLFL